MVPEAGVDVTATSFTVGGPVAAAPTVAVAALVSVSVWLASSSKVTRTLRVVPRSASPRV